MQARSRSAQIASSEVAPFVGLPRGSPLVLGARAVVLDGLGRPRWTCPASSPHLAGKTTSNPPHVVEEFTREALNGFCGRRRKRSHCSGSQDEPRSDLLAWTASASAVSTDS